MEARKSFLGSQVHCFTSTKLKNSHHVRSVKFHRNSAPVPVAPHLWARRLKTSANASTESEHANVKPGIVSCLLKNTLKLAAASAASFSLLFSPPHVAAEEMVVQLSSSEEVVTVQRTLVEAWSIIRNTYVDPTFNKQGAFQVRTSYHLSEPFLFPCLSSDWNMKLKETMVKLSSLNSGEEAYSQVRNMLATLGDPFTRIVTPKEYENFRINNDGSVEGVGLLIAADADSGKLIVLGTIDGGPAQRAGVLAGDELVAINDEAMKGFSVEDAAIKLRGKPGTLVDLKLRPVNDSLTDGKLKEVKLKRETILLSPVFTALLPHKNSSGNISNIGYIRLSTFSQNAAEDMKNAISSLEGKLVDSYILDLRNNPGGLVRAGLAVAEMWLDGNETLVNTVDRRGITFPINIASGHALTHDPLVVLVNEGSASASEILAGALHDNGRALIVGHKTYGKGKIQSVSQLEDGSALFVTVAKYLSPSMHQIDQIGIAPDVECSPGVFQSKEDEAEAGKSEKSFLERDACVLVAEKLMK